MARIAEKWIKVLAASKLEYCDFSPLGYRDEDKQNTAQTQL